MTPRTILFRLLGLSLLLSLISQLGCAATLPPPGQGADPARVCQLNLDNWHFVFAGTTSNLFGDEHPSSINMPIKWDLDQAPDITMASDSPDPLTISFDLAQDSKLLLAIPRDFYQGYELDRTFTSASGEMSAWLWRGPPDSVIRDNQWRAFLSTPNADRGDSSCPMMGSVRLVISSNRLRWIDIHLATDRPVPLFRQYFEWHRASHRMYLPAGNYSLGSGVTWKWLDERQTRPDTLPAEINGTFRGCEIPPKPWWWI